MKVVKNPYASVYLSPVTQERVQTLSIEEEKILGTSRVGPKHRITLVKDVQERLKVKIGDKIVYLAEPDGKIVLKTTSYEQLLKTARAYPPSQTQLGFAQENLRKTG